MNSLSTLRDNPKLYRPLQETKYLSAENAQRYRVIMRYIYRQHQSMTYWLSAKEIQEALCQLPQFSGYTSEQNRQDLDALVAWGNLHQMQDTARVATIDEFKNRQYRYQLSPYSVEIEEMTLRLENLEVESASLEPTLLERLRVQIGEIPGLLDADLKTVGSWWSSLNADFTRLNKNYQDYLRDFHSTRAEELMKTREFMVFKDKFIDYFRDFIQELQLQAVAIEDILLHMSEMTQAALLERVLEYEESVPRLEFQVDKQALTENVNGKWQSLRRWFITNEAGESEALRLLDMTNEIIRKITRFASQILENLNRAANRKEEYRALCRMFLDSESMAEAHMLSAYAFGVVRPKRIWLNAPRQTESSNSSIYEEEQVVFTLKPRIRAYRERAERSVMLDHGKAKQEALQQIRLQRLAEQRLVEQYIIDDRIVLSELPRIDRNLRSLLLRWISRALQAPQQRAKTEYGRYYRLVLQNREEAVELVCEDGVLRMPNYVLQFEPEKVKGGSEDGE